MSRVKAAAVVGDLARGSRSVALIAKRHHVPEQTVVALRRTYGPALKDLSAAAGKLRRPGVKVEPAAPTSQSGPRSSGDDVSPDVSKVMREAKLGRDGLTSAERAQLRGWAESLGRKCGTRPSADLVAAWEEAGRPEVEAASADEEPAAETASDPDPEVPDVLAEAECFDGDCGTDVCHTHGRACTPGCDCHGVDDPTPDTTLDYDLEVPIKPTADVVAGVEECTQPISSAWPGHLEAVTIREAVLAGEVLDVVAYAAEYLPGALATWVTGYEHLRDLVADHRHEAQEVAQVTEQVTVWAAEQQLIVSDEQVRALAQRILWVS